MIVWEVSDSFFFSFLEIVFGAASCVEILISFINL